LLDLPARPGPAARAGSSPALLDEWLKAHRDVVDFAFPLGLSAGMTKASLTRAASLMRPSDAFVSIVYTACTWSPTMR
jgi:hypothetical protein